MVFDLVPSANNIYLSGHLADTVMQSNLQIESRRGLAFLLKGTGAYVQL